MCPQKIKSKKTDKDQYPSNIQIQCIDKTHIVWSSISDTDVATLIICTIQIKDIYTIQI